MRWPSSWRLRALADATGVAQIADTAYETLLPHAARAAAGCLVDDRPRPHRTRGRPEGAHGQGAAIDTTKPASKLVFEILAALAEFERELISERTSAGLASARGRKGGRPFKMTPAKLRLGAASMGQPGTKVGELCAELGITRQTLYRHMSPAGELPAGRAEAPRR